MMQTQRIVILVSLAVGGVAVICPIMIHSAAQTEAFNQLVLSPRRILRHTRNGLWRLAIMDPQQIKQLIAVFSWSAWTASALRHNLSYS